MSVAFCSFTCWKVVRWCACAQHVWKGWSKIKSQNVQNFFFSKELKIYRNRNQPDLTLTSKLVALTQTLLPCIFGLIDIKNILTFEQFDFRPFWLIRIWHRLKRWHTWTLPPEHSW
jgi:hypothetical protein